MTKPETKIQPQPTTRAAEGEIDHADPFHDPDPVHGERCLRDGGAGRGPGALLPAACGSSPPGTTSPDNLSPSDESSLAGTEWILTAIRGEPPIGEAEITLVVDDSSAGGSSGCNHYGGALVMTADTFRLDEIVATAMACEDARLMDQESDYLAILAEPAGWEIRAGKLVLTANGETLVFRAAGD